MRGGGILVGLRHFLRSLHRFFAGSIADVWNFVCNPCESARDEDHGHSVLHETAHFDSCYRVQMCGFENFIVIDRSGGVSME